MPSTFFQHRTVSSACRGIGPFGIRELVYGLGLLLCITGCSSVIDWSKKPPDMEAASKRNMAPGPIQVRVDSFGKPLREGQEATITGSEFLNQVDRLLSEQRMASLGAYVERFPDVALEVLRSTKSSEASRPAVRKVAEIYDRRWLASSQDGWTDLIDRRARSPKTYAAFEASRATVLEKIRQGQTQEAAGTKIVSQAESLGHPLLVIDAAQLQSLALMLDEQPAQAAEVLTRAAKLASPRDRYQTAQLLLLVSDLHRRTGNDSLADDHWQWSVELAADTIVGAHPAFDPQFWDRAAYLRPVAARQWPQTAARRLLERVFPASLAAVASSQGAIDTDLSAKNTEMPSTLTPGECEAAVWGAIGLGQFERDENQSALLSLKRAESSSTREAYQDRLRLLQAVTLSRLDQVNAATAILVALAGKPNAAVARPAMATLGAQKLQKGDLAAGFKLLSKALETEPPIDWPERGKAEGDLGLAYLMRGDVANGLRWCHAAQSRFSADHDLESLTKSLSNEAKFYEHTGKKHELAATRERLNEIER
jgi:hypothetical protein